MTDDELINLIQTHDESEILDYKENLSDAQAIGEYASALGNSALIYHQPAAYLIWGVEDKSKNIVGTHFNPYLTKASDKNQMPLITFVESYLDPKIALEWEQHEISGKNVLILIIDVTHLNRPIKFHGKGFIRSGTSKKGLAEFPEKERQIWQSFESTTFESQTALSSLSFEAIADVLDIDKYASMLGLKNKEIIIQSLLDQHLITEQGFNFNITNLGAYTLAKNINNFTRLKRRSLRITKYNGDKKVDNATFDRQGEIGIALSFNNVITNIMNLLPYTEDYSSGERQDIPVFPLIAIRELVANTLVHQDFTVSGMYPSVEIFDNRIVFTNPGTPLIDPERFLDYPPISRNSDLADLMGAFNIVESRGTGIDKVVNALEINELPALDIQVQNMSTSVTLHTKKKLKDMSTTEKNQSIYWHACLYYIEDQQISNASLRKRFKLTTKDSSLISKSINSAVQAKLIKPYDPSVGRKFIKYIPFWGTDALNGSN